MGDGGGQILCCAHKKFKKIMPVKSTPNTPVRFRTGLGSLKLKFHDKNIITLYV